MGDWPRPELQLSDRLPPASADLLNSFTRIRRLRDFATESVAFSSHSLSFSQSTGVSPSHVLPTCGALNRALPMSSSSLT